MECDALKDWKLNIFKTIDRLISFYSRIPKISYHYLKKVYRNFIESMSWFQQIKLQTTLLLVDGYTTLTL